jgi:hypothetical protein
MRTRGDVKLTGHTDIFPAMNIEIWLPPVVAAVIGALLSPVVGKGLITLAGARARRIKHVPVDGAELYANGVPMDEVQFRSHPQTFPNFSDPRSSLGMV